MTIELEPITIVTRTQGNNPLTIKIKCKIIRILALKMGQQLSNYSTEAVTNTFHKSSPAVVKETKNQLTTPILSKHLKKIVSRVQSGRQQLRRRMNTPDN